MCSKDSFHLPKTNTISQPGTISTTNFTHSQYTTNVSGTVTPFQHSLSASYNSLNLPQDSHRSGLASKTRHNTGTVPGLYILSRRITESVPDFDICTVRCRHGTRAYKRKRRETCTCHTTYNRLWPLLSPAWESTKPLCARLNTDCIQPLDGMHGL